MLNKFVVNNKVLTLATAAKEAGSCRELEDVCERMGIADLIILNNSSLIVCKHALSAVYGTLKKYPELRILMNYFGTLDGFKRHKDDLFKQRYGSLGFTGNMLAKQVSGSIYSKIKKGFEGSLIAAAFFYAVGDNKFGGVLVNNNMLTEQQTIDNIISNERAGQFPKDCFTIKSIVDHEMGHLLDFLLGVSTSKRCKRILSSYTVEEMWRGLSGNSIQNGEISPLESVADGFMETCNNKNPRPISVRLRTLIDEMYMEAYHGR